MNKKSFLLTAAIAGLSLAAGCGESESEQASVQDEPAYGECHGINACKGQGECGTKTHTCAGLNACKGQGWIRMEKDPCEEKGGHWQDFTMEM